MLLTHTLQKTVAYTKIAGFFFSGHDVHKTWKAIGYCQNALLCSQLNSTHSLMRKLEVHSVERIYLRQRSFDTSKPHVAPSTFPQYQYVHGIFPT